MDEIHPEMVKALDIVVLVLIVAWRWVTVAVDWHTGVVVFIFKTGDRRVRSNYWAITLLSLSGKGYTEVLEGRLRLIVKPWIQKEQFRSCPGCGIVDSALTI